MALNKLNHNYTDPLSVSSLTVSGNLVVGGALNIPLSVTAGSFVKSGGTSAQYLMADGSVSSGSVGGVTSFSAGTTGLTPSTGTTGAVTLAGKLVVANGGTGTGTAGITAFNNITGYTATGATGTTSTNLVFSTSPTLTTPTLGVATATSINKMSITAPATSSTLAVADGKTFTSSNTITLTATDGSTLAIGGGGTLGTAAYTASTAYQASNTTLTGVAGLSSSGTGLVKNTAGTWSYDTNAYITGSSPTITTPVIDVINAASATGTTQSLFPNTTTGTMAIGAGLTTGTVNIATGGSSTNAINMGNTNTTVTINGNLDVKGITTTIESTTVTVKDKNIELASVVGSPTDTTADGGGITVKGGTDKTFNYVNATPAFTSSENMDLASGKAYKIAGTTVLSGTGLGTGVTGSSLTSVGTIGTGTWQGSVIGGTYGGTGVNNGSSTITLAGNFVTSGANSLTLTTTGTTSLTLPTSGTVSTEDAAFYYAMIL